MKKTWTMVAPPEPGANVTRVLDKDGDAWERTTPDRWRLVTHTTDARSWDELIRQFGPVTAEVPDPIVVTDEMLAAAWGSGWDLGVVRQNLTAALRAGGYAVAE